MVPIRTLLGSTRAEKSTVLYVSSLFIISSPHMNELYRAACADHCVIVIMMFLLWAHSTYDAIKMNAVVHVAKILEIVYKGVVCPLPDAVVRVNLAAMSPNIVAKNLDTPLLAHSAIHRDLEVDWLVQHCPGWYS